MATVKGVWVWNDTVDESTIIGWSVDFSSNSENFSYLGTATDPGMGFHIVYDNMTVYSEARKWTVAENYKIINFGSTPQTIGDNFYAYLTANATPQSSPSTNLSDFLTEVAEAIRTKKGTSAQINAQDFPEEIASIETGIDTSDATATAGDILLGKTAYVKGQKLTGTIATWSGAYEDISTSAAVNFATDSWETISAACKDGSYKTVYQVGDTKDIELSTGETITVAIMGFDHDDLSDGSGKAPITLGMTELLATTYPMNSTATNAGGWDDCLMRTTTMATLLSQLPSDLQGVIKQVNKKATAGSQSENITTSADKLWLLAMSEIFSATSIENSSTSTIANYADAYNAEGTQYKYYENLIGDNNGGTTTNSLLIKKLSNGSGSAYYWWLRSPSVSSSSVFRYITSMGYVNANVAHYTDGVSFGFCVG